MLEIFGTIGPACSDRDTLAAMITEGMTGIRLNCSHAGLQESREMLMHLRQAEAETGKKVDLMIDLQGPETRIGVLKEPLFLSRGEIIPAEMLCLSDAVSAALMPEDRILLDDGKILAEMTDENHMQIIRGGMLQRRKSIKIEGRTIDTPILTEQDLRNISLIREYGVTSVMQPFVHSGSDLRRVRSVLKEHGCGDVRLFAKIETEEGASDIASIIPECDTVVIARGDLGNCMPLWKLPAVQKEISHACLQQNRPFMVVTQMLTSMIDSPVPTRAEVSDIFNAAVDGASSVMVTNETAVGKYPAEVIHYLSMTACEGFHYRKKCL